MKLKILTLIVASLMAGLAYGVPLSGSELVALTGAELGAIRE